MYPFANQQLVCLVGMSIAILGMLLITCLDNNGSHRVGRLIGYYLTQASPTPFVALLSLIATNIAGWTKKTTVAALYLIAYCVGNIIGPQVFRAKDAPNYRPTTAQPRSQSWCAISSVSLTSCSSTSGGAARMPRRPPRVQIQAIKSWRASSSTISPTMRTLSLYMLCERGLQCQKQE